MTGKQDNFHIRVCKSGTKFSGLARKKGPLLGAVVLLYWDIILRD